MRAVALRYVLAPACVLLAVLAQLSPASVALPLGGLFVFAVLGAAWFGGPGPGFVAAVLSTFTLPQLIAMNYPLLGGFLDLPRFITFSGAALAVGWWSLRRRQVEAALRESEKRYELVIDAIDEGFWDWIRTGDKLYLSPRFLEIFGFPPGTTFAGRAAMFERLSMPPEDRAALEHAINEHWAGKTARMELEFRILVDRDVRWIHVRGLATRDSRGEVIRTIGAVSDVTARKRAEEALRVSEERHARAMEASAAGHWDWNMLTDQLFVSERALEMFELPPGRLPPTRAEFMSVMSKYRAEMDEGVEAALHSGRFDRVYRVVTQTGPVRWLHSRGKVFKDAAGTPVRMAGSVADITERKHAEQALRNSEQRYALAMEAAGDGHTDWDLVTGEFYISPRLLEIVGHPPDARFADRADWVRRFPFHPEDRPKWEAAIAAHYASRESHFKMEVRIVVRGEVRWTAFHFLSTRDAEGKPIRWSGSIGDITEQKRVEEALRASQERISLAMEASEEGYIDSDVQTDRFIVSERMREIFEVPAGTRITYRSDFNEQFRFYSDEDAKAYDDAIRTLAAQGGPDRHEFEFRVVLPSGKVKWIWTRSKVTRDAEGRALRRVGVVADITERKLAEQALRESQQRYELAIAASGAGYFDWHIPTNTYFASPRALELAGFPPDTPFVTREQFLAGCNIPPEDYARWDAARAKVLTGTAERASMELRYVVRGETRWHVISGIGSRDDDGKVVRWVGSMTDITDRKRVEEALRESEERYQRVIAATEAGHWDWDIVEDKYYVSPSLVKMGGLPPGTVITSRADFHARVPFHPEDLRKWERELHELFASGGSRLSTELRLMLPAGVRWVRLDSMCFRDAAGKVIRWTGSSIDITGRKLAEEGLKTMESRLRQAQRLEAMGTLAGGIAHDFNNILGAILGYGEMAQENAPKGSLLESDLNNIIVAGERGRALVARVLAFSRSAVGERVPVHVERVVREALDQVLAKLPPSVTVHARLHAGPAAVLGDATQIHQVASNLATNAVHAMPSGGRLRVDLAALRVEAARMATVGRLEPGDYVVLTVVDTGTGMAPEILDHIFEPYYTTKEVGTGTGLGLSLVHGIVTELRGAIDVASKPGAGSTFTIHLPRCGDAAPGRDETMSTLPRGGGQRVLVVDDEEPLVLLATRTLEKLGYAPVGFTSSDAALAAFRADPQHFDALITDERMPGMSGSVLIQEVRGIRGSIPVVLMSGYLGAVADQADDVLQKPLSARDLATSLAKLLRPVVGRDTTR